MRYAILGRTGLRVSRLGFGAMRLPMKGDRVDRDKAIPLLHRAFELGVNYVDSAVGYCNRDSQRVVGEALKGWREKIIVSTKNHHYDKTDDRPWWKNLDDSLRRLDVECIDVYNFHGLSWHRFNEQLRGRDGQLKWAQKARDQGLISHICFSCHDKPEGVVKLAETGEFDVITAQYNLIDRANEGPFKACRKAGMGVVVMGPVGGGRLGATSEAMQKMLPGARNVPEVALRFVLANPDVTVALSGMSEMHHVEQNVRVAGRATALSAGEKRRIRSALNRYKKLADLYCTGCNYCMPCPAGVDIPGNFMALNLVRVYELPQAGRQQYRWTRGKAITCLACGKCMSKCPQNIDIISQLRETVRTLDDAYGKLLVTVKPVKVSGLRRRGGRIDMDVQCRLECYNVSDEDVMPGLEFSPAGGITVARAGRVGRLAPFQRKRQTLTVKARSLRPGRPLRLCPSVGGPVEMIYSHDPLPLAVAGKAARRRPRVALAKTPQVRAETWAGRPKPPPAATRARYSLGGRFAYDADALHLQFDVRGVFSRLAGAGLALRSRDHVWLLLNLGAKRASASGRSPRGPILGFAIPPAGDAAATVEAHRRSLNAEALSLIRLEWAGGPKRRTLRVRVPWKALGAKTPSPGAVLQMNFGLLCHSRNGRTSRRLTWVAGDAGYLILVK